MDRRRCAGCRGRVVVNQLPGHGILQRVVCGFAIPVAQAFGGKDYHKMRSYVANALRIAVAFAAVITLLTCMFCTKILGLVNTPADIFHDAWTFLFLQFLAIPFTMGYNLLSGFIRALGNSKQPFYFLIIASLINIALDVLLILVMGMGVAIAGCHAFVAGLCHAALLALHPRQDETAYPHRRRATLRQ